METNEIPGIVNIILQQYEDCDQDCDCYDCETQYDSNDGPTDCK